MKDSKIIILLCLLGGISYLPFLGGLHLFDWDEINFAEISREMIVLNDYMRVHINFEPFWEKPPLFSWLQVLCMKVLGVNEYAARLPNAIAGILTLVTLFKFGTYYQSKKFGLIWALVYWGSILPFLYFKSGIIDPWFNFFIFTALFFYYKYLRERQHDGNSPITTLIYSGLLLGLGALTKGPVAFLLYGLTILIYYIVTKFKFFPSLPKLLILIISSLFCGGLWLGLETAINGPWFIQTFTEYQIRLLTTHDAGHKGFLGYHFVVMLLGCFPASLFAFLPAWKKYRNFEFGDRILFRLMFILLAVVLVIFSLVQSKIVHYSSLGYFPLTFLAAFGIYQLLKKEVSIPKAISWGVGFLTILFAGITAALPWIGSNIDMLKPLLEKDPFGLASLDAAVSWSWWHAAPTLVILITLGVYLLSFQKQTTKRIATLFVGTILFVNAILFLQVNNIEAYTQRAMIEFCKDHADEDAYYQVIGMKSYAHLFYGDKKTYTLSASNNQQWLLESELLDKDVYFIAKIHRALDLSLYPKVKELYRKNGFVFYKRDRERIISIE